MFGRRRRRRVEWSLSTDLGDGWHPLPLNLGSAELGEALTRGFLDDAPAALGHTMTRHAAHARAAEVVELVEAVREQAIAARLVLT